MVHCHYSSASGLGMLNCEEGVSTMNQQSKLSKKDWKLDKNTRVVVLLKRLEVRFAGGGGCGSPEDVTSKMATCAKVGNLIKPSHPCRKCGKTFTIPRGLQIHRIRHNHLSYSSVTEKPHRCGLCAKSFCSVTALNTHKRIHNGERPFQCSTCKKSFMSEATLRRHQLLHTKQQYFCKECPARFSHRCNLFTHSKKHTQEGMFRCNLCKEQLSSEHILECHIRVHTGEKPYICQMCKAEFAHPGLLEKHHKIHGANAIARAISNVAFVNYNCASNLD